MTVEQFSFGPFVSAQILPPGFVRQVVVAESQGGGVGVVPPEELPGGAKTQVLEIYLSQKVGSVSQWAWVAPNAAQPCAGGGKHLAISLLLVIQQNLAIVGSGVQRKKVKIVAKIIFFIFIPEKYLFPER